MGRGPKKHLKRLDAPHNWMLDKMAGKWAPKPSPGPHKQRECLPLTVLLRNRLHYAISRKDVTSILMSRNIKVDGKVRTDSTFPTGFMDVVSVEKTNEYMRMLYDVKGRWISHRITKEEAAYKLCKVRRVELGKLGIPYLVTHDARTIRYPSPDIAVQDSIQVDIATGKIMDHVKFEVGNICTVTGGANTGRTGMITRVEYHDGNPTICHVKDVHNHSFATRLNNIFVIGKGSKPLISLPKGKGIKLTILEERDRRHKAVAAAPAAAAATQ
jgi:small subunit ribosomal protein S4e